MWSVLCHGQQHLSTQSPAEDIGCLLLKLPLVERQNWIIMETEGRERAQETLCGKPVGEGWKRTSDKDLLSLFCHCVEGRLTEMAQ